VGRANWSCADSFYSAELGADQQNFYAWRLGAPDGTFFPRVQFPIDDPAALEQANRGRYYEFDDVRSAQLESDATALAIDRVGPAVILSNSAGGLRALLTRLKSDNVKAIVAYEIPDFVLPEGWGAPREPGPYGPDLCVRRGI